MPGRTPAGISKPTHPVTKMNIEKAPRSMKLNKKSLILFSLLAVAGVAQAEVTLADPGTKVLSASGVTPVYPGLEIAPNTPLNISGKSGGKVVKVSGNDHCSKLMDNMTGQPEQQGCVVLDKPVVTVHYALNGKSVTEQWEVKVVGDRIWLQRPNGVVVRPAN